MKVLVVSDVSAETVLGGAERMLTNHIRALHKAGHQVTVLTRQPNEHAPLEIRLTGDIQEYRLPYHGDRGISGLLQLSREAEQWWICHSSQFDAVVSEQPFVIWALQKAGCDLPRLQVCYSFAFEEYLTRHAGRWNLIDRIAAFAMRRLEKNVYQSAGKLLVLSRYTERRMEEAFGLMSDRIVVSSGGVEMPELPSASRSDVRESFSWKGPVVMTLRNLVPRTGVDLLIEAAHLLKEDFPALQWCVIGQGALLQKLREQAVELEVSDRIEFTGYLPEEEVKKRMYAADLFMLPTRDLEGFGLVTLEANSCGLPVVATPVTANREVVPSLPLNLLSDDVSGEALARAVHEMLDEKKGEDEQSRLALQKAVESQYAWHHHDDAFVQSVEALVK